MQVLWQTIQKRKQEEGIAGVVLLVRLPSPARSTHLDAPRTAALLFALTITSKILARSAGPMCARGGATGGHERCDRMLQRQRVREVADARARKRSVFAAPISRSAPENNNKEKPALPPAAAPCRPCFTCPYSPRRCLLHLSFGSCDPSPRRRCCRGVKCWRHRGMPRTAC